MAKKEKENVEEIKKEEKVELTDKQKKSKALQATISLIEKQFGKGSILSDSVPRLNIGVISTGILSVDDILGGGLAKGRVIELFGPESCISKDSFLQFEVYDKKNGKRINHKGGTISRLYERFHNTDLESNPKQGRHLQNNDSDFYIKSVNHENCIIRNQVLDVVKTGKKECYKIKTEHGQILNSTLEHKYMTPNGFKELRDIKEGDIVFIHNNTRNIGRKKYKKRKDVYVKYHPKAPIKIVKDPKTGYDYPYYRCQESRLAYEAHLNNCSFEAFCSMLNTWAKPHINDLIFLPSNIHVHHEDEDFNNNNISNLKLVDPSEHGRIHAKDRIKNLSFVAIESKIVSIEKVGFMETYDIKCAYPYNNYIAEGIVVHNSGKTTLALTIAAEVQKNNEEVAFIDAEHALDLDYAKALGLDVGRTIISQPDNGEQALEITEKLARSGAIRLIIVDSVAALTPQAEIEAEMGSSHMGLQARLMSQALRKLTGVLNKTETTIIFINQLRSKIGVFYGNPEVTTGGNALKFYSSQRLETRKATPIKNGENIIGYETKIKCVKNKIAPPFKECLCDLIFGIGFDKFKDLINIAVKNDIIEKSGSWYSYNGSQLGQGLNNSIEVLKNNSNIEKEILEKINNLS